MKESLNKLENLANTMSLSLHKWKEHTQEAEHYRTEYYKERTVFLRELSHSLSSFSSSESSPPDIEIADYIELLINIVIAGFSYLDDESQSVVNQLYRLIEPGTELCELSYSKMYPPPTYWMRRVLNIVDSEPATYHKENEKFGYFLSNNGEIYADPQILARLTIRGWLQESVIGPREYAYALSDEGKDILSKYPISNMQTPKPDTQNAIVAMSLLLKGATLEDGVGGARLCKGEEVLDKIPTSSFYGLLSRGYLTRIGGKHSSEYTLSPDGKLAIESL